VVNDKWLLVMRKVSTVFVSLLFCLLVYGQQNERIIRFHSDIVIDTVGWVAVTEYINVYAAGKDIKRGIIREIPVYREDVNGKRKKVDINILSVHCNGQPVKYRSENKGFDILIYIGDENVLLTSGEYEYTIAYTSRGHIGFFDTYDELYWNVTGNKWVFEIEKASATVTLPDGASAESTSCYTGVYGSTGKDCSVEDKGNVQRFTSNRLLKPGEGLTVAVSFPRDIVQRSSLDDDWDTLLFAFFGLTGLFIFAIIYFITSLTVGKRPKKPVVIPTFTPPNNWSPATIRYLFKRKYDNAAFTATLIDAAVKGAISIECENKSFALVNKQNTAMLSPEEQQIHSTIFGNSAKVNVSENNHLQFSQAADFLKKTVEKNWKITDLIRENSTSIVIGGLIIGVIITLYTITGSENVFWAYLLTSPIQMICLLELWMNGFRKNAGTGVIIGGFVLMLICPAVAIGIMLDENSPAEIHWLSAGFFALMAVLYLYYARRVKVPTEQGAKIAAELEGFRMYMKTAEEHRLNILTPPEKTPELFEALLPYAIALDVSNQWCKKFDNVLSKCHYHPKWYNDYNDFVEKDFNKRFETLTSSLNKSVVSAQRDPASSSSSSGSGSWSSGSRGGGHSGGGGGGGGGRGW
jgi:uncharacterized membrane protein YgcG